MQQFFIYTLLKKQSNVTTLSSNVLALSLKYLIYLISYWSLSLFLTESTVKAGSSRAGSVAPLVRTPAMLAAMLLSTVAALVKLAAPPPLTND